MMRKIQKIYLIVGDYWSKRDNGFIELGHLPVNMFMTIFIFSITLFLFRQSYCEDRSLIRNTINMNSTDVETDKFIAQHQSQACSWFLFRADRALLHGIKQ